MTLIAESDSAERLQILIEEDERIEAALHELLSQRARIRTSILMEEARLFHGAVAVDLAESRRGEVLFTDLYKGSGRTLWAFTDLAGIQ